VALSDGKCDGPYERPCIEYADDRVNIRLYQWCPACLFALSSRLNHQPFTVNPPKTVNVERFDELSRRWRGPLRLQDRAGKYYGTRVVDADGETVIKFWTASGEPSEREKAYFGRWTPERWADDCSDCHWECERDLVAALEFIALSRLLAEAQSATSPKGSGDDLPGKS
jgi:hypothetical protein